MLSAFAMTAVWCLSNSLLTSDPFSQSLVKQDEPPVAGFNYRVHESDKISANEHKLRRLKFRESLKPNQWVLLVTNPSQQRSNDTDFPFRPNSDFWYLTGFEEPDAAILIGKNEMQWQGRFTNEILFINEKSPAQETWTGIRMGTKVALESLKIETVLSNRQFKTVLDEIKEQPSFVSIIDTPRGAADQIQTFLNQFNLRFANVPKDSGAVRALGVQRSLKSQAEIDLTWKSIRATAKAHEEALKSCTPGMREYQIKSLVEYVFGIHGCESVAYGSIVGAGVHSCVLHYVDARKLIEKNDFICMDVGGEYHGYASDVTRSYPASGRFSKPQKEIYELVQRAQEAGVAACKPGAAFNIADQVARKIIGEGLVKLGVIQKPEEARKYFMHGTSHYVGLDVHDPGDSGPLKESQILTVEPGIYIKEGSPCDRKYWNIGVRIEDTILITKEGNINMSGGLVTRSVAGIEKLMAQKGLGNILSILEFQPMFGAGNVSETH